VPLLVSAGRSVAVLDPRGFGESDKPAQGYDLDTAARDLHRFLELTNLASAGGIDVVAHDAGDVDCACPRCELSSGGKTTGADGVTDYAWPPRRRRNRSQAR
jgi:pimeloyl-ACP methyl ester carboxylesterase